MIFQSKIQKSTRRLKKKEPAADSQQSAFLQCLGREHFYG